MSRYASDYVDLFEKEKIIWQRVCKEPNFTLDQNNHYLLDSLAFITSKNEYYNLKYILCFLNNPITKWYLESIGHQYSNKGFLVSNQYVNRLPIFPLEVSEQKPFIELADRLLELNKKHVSEVNSFKKWIIRTFNINKLSQKLVEYNKLSFDDFLDEMKKHKVDTKQRSTHDLLEHEFENSLNVLLPLQKEIKQLEKEIDNIVYELYDLTPEEIKIIEDSLK